MGTPPGRDIKKTRKLLRKHWFPNTVPIALENLEAGPPMAPCTDPLTLLLPVNLTTKERAPYRSPGYTGMPVSMEPLAPEKEAELLLKLISELNSNFYLELSDDIQVSDKDWTASGSQAETTRKFILVGNSHVTRLALALEEEGHEVRAVTLDGGCLSEDSAENTAYQISELVQEADPLTTIVYFMFDNNIYKAKKENGNIGPAVRIKGSSKYHVVGDLCTVEREEFKVIFNMAVPLLRAGGDLNKIVLSLLVRYAQSPCCDDPSHCTNFGSRSYREMLGEAMAHLEGWVKDLTFSKRIRNFKVISATEAVTISAGEIMKKKELKEHLGKDPVHLTAAGYAKLAEVLLVQSGGEFTRAKRKAEGHVPGKKVSNLCNKRQKWLMEDDTAAQRHYNLCGRGNNNSGQRRPYRGRGGLN
jgi:hypothetical protein